MTEEISESLPQRLRQLRPRLTAVIRHYGVDPADAEDVLQEVVLAAVERWKAIRDLEAFLMVVTFNQCRRWIKRHLRKRAALVPIEECTVVEPVIESAHQAVERRDRLNEVLGLLKPRQRKALSLRAQGFTHKQVEAALGLRPKSGRILFVCALRRIARRSPSFSKRDRGAAAKPSRSLQTKRPR